MSAAWVELGRLGKPYGLEGWLHCESFSDPPDRLMKFPAWRLQRPGAADETAELQAARRHGDHWVVRLAGVADADAAALLTGRLIAVPRAQLPAPADGEFYRSDLIGLKVVNLADKELGRVDHFVDTPGQAVMVVRGEREYWLPAVPRHVVQVDLAGGWVRVDWPEDF